MSSESANPPMDAVASVGRKRDVSLIALVIGLIGLALGLTGLFLGLKQGDARPVFGWLIGLAYWISIAVGMLFMLMIFNVFDSGWSVVLRRQLEHALGAFKWLFVIFLPLVAIPWVFPDQAGILWAWLDPYKILPGGEEVGKDLLYLKKSAYLNKGFFSLRVVLFFGVWMALAGLLRRFSFTLDKDGDPKWYQLTHNVSAAGIYLCALAATFGAVDWFKSVEYHWFSTMYGVWFFAESMRAGLAASVILCVLLASKGYLRDIYNDCHSYYLGCLMLAFTVFWAYISFSQYFLVYSANIPEETFWYNIRELNLDGSKNSWWWVSMALVFLHFIFPFLYLLWYKNKFGGRILFISIWILFFHFADIYWNILPGRVPEENVVGYVVRPFQVHWSEVCTWIGVGGICCWAFLSSAKQAKPIPVRDPRVLESIQAQE